MTEPKLPGAGNLIKLFSGEGIAGSLKELEGKTIEGYSVSEEQGSITFDCSDGSYVYDAVGD